MVFTAAKSNASKFTLFPSYQYRSLQMPLAKVTPAPIAHEELHFCGLKHASSPPQPVNWRVHQVGLFPRHFPSDTDPFLKRFLAYRAKYL